MDFIRFDKMKTDGIGMEFVEEGFPKFPIVFYYDEDEDLSGRDIIRWHRHPQMEFIIAYDNPLEVSVEDNKFILNKNEAAWINVNRLHMIKSADGTSIANLIILAMLPEFIIGKESMLYQKYINPIAENLELSYITFLRNENWHDELIKLLEEAVNVYETHRFGHELAVHIALNKAWLTIVQHLDEIPRQKSAQTTDYYEERIKTMLEYIHNNFAERLTLNDIADSAHVSKSECNRCFKRNLGVTPIQYLTEYRLKNSVKFLSSGYSVTTTAILCGFDDVSYFDRLFRRTNGITPSEYQKLFNRTE